MSNISVSRIFLAIILWLLMSGSVAFAVDSAATRETLKGLQGVYVIVEEMQPNVQRYARKPGLTKEQLQKDIELRLKERGIKALSRDEWVKTPGKPVLYVAVNTHETEKYQYAYDIKMELQQLVKMEANPNINALAATWSMNMTGMADIGSLNIIKGDVEVLLERFQQAYWAVNGRR
ncbi:MAG: hypothetical protein ACLP9S_04815 [Syntrophales bacterium]